MTTPPLLTAREKLLLTLRRRRRGSGFWYGLAIEVIWPFVMAFTRISWSGGERIPRTGGVLLAANHVSMADPIYDVAFTIVNGRMPRFLAKSELWGVPVVKWVLGRGGHIPVYRESARAGDAYREAVKALERGEVVVFYPEATYTADPDGWPMKAKNGIGRIAMMTGVPVIPIANWGTQDLLPPDDKPRPWPRKRVTVLAGPPVDLSDYIGKPRTRTNLDGATGAIMSAVTKLVGEVRGEIPPSIPFDPDARREPSGPPSALGERPAS